MNFPAFSRLFFPENTHIQDKKCLDPKEKGASGASGRTSDLIEHHEILGTALCIEQRT